jgi:hypothetical protein
VLWSDVVVVEAGALSGLGAAARADAAAAPTEE